MRGSFRKMKTAISTPALLLIAFVVGLSSGLFLLPFWVEPFLAAAKTGNPADWIGFAGNFSAGIMTLIAAIIAWFAVQFQIKAQQGIEDRKVSLRVEQDEKNKFEAKMVASVVLAQPVHAASGMLYAARKAFAATTEIDIAKWDQVTDQANAQVEQTLSHFGLQQISAELAVVDRLGFLVVLSHLSSIVNIYYRPQGILNRTERLAVLVGRLERVHFYLKAFDEELAAVFKRDGIDRV